MAALAGLAALTHVSTLLITLPALIAATSGAKDHAAAAGTYHALGRCVGTRIFSAGRRARARVDGFCDLLLRDAPSDAA